MKRDYGDPIYKYFRSLVLKRDKHKCQYPGCKKKSKTGSGLEVHHIIPWSQAASLRYEPSNGILLCKDHHKECTGHETAYQSLFYQIVDKNDAKNR